MEVDEDGSECHSGWTKYLEHPFEKEGSRLAKVGDSQAGVEGEGGEEEAEEEEGFSMISDASSGPPRIHENWRCDEDSNAMSSSSVLVKRKRTEFGLSRQASARSLDDTASSSDVFVFSHDACGDAESSSEFSVTYLKGGSKSSKPFAFFC
ncbi:uncharacterized protein LOC144702662 isoform X2 [Wolffia australiana]